jgi:hypothetical protein
MCFAHPETMKMRLWRSFFLAKTLRRQERRSPPSLRSLRLCEKYSPSSPWLRNAYFQAKAVEESLHQEEVGLRPGGEARGAKPWG